jgi:hypothetical protein
MNFLDKSGLNHLWTKIKANFGTASVNNFDYRTELDNVGHISIPFVANHQIVNMDYSSNINVCDWFKGASEGGILEIVFTEARNGYTYCINDEGISMIYKTAITSTGPILKNLSSLATAYNTYARFIKLDGKLIVAEFVTNR